MLFDLGNSAVLRAAKDAEFGIERESLQSIVKRYGEIEQ